MWFSVLHVLASVSVLFSPSMCLDDLGEPPKFGKELHIRLTVCSRYIMSTYNLVVSHSGVEELSFYTQLCLTFS